MLQQHYPCIFWVISGHRNLTELSKTKHGFFIHKKGIAIFVVGEFSMLLILLIQVQSISADWQETKKAGLLWIKILTSSLKSITFDNNLHHKVSSIVLVQVVEMMTWFTEKANVELAWGREKGVCTMNILQTSSSSAIFFFIIFCLETGLPFLTVMIF